MGDKTKEMTKKRLFEEIAELKDKLKETNDFFRGKIIELETTLHSLINVVDDEEDILEPMDIKKTKARNSDKVRSSSSLLQCNLCEMKFTRFCDLECHMKASHKKCKEFECDTCKKTFVTNWRLRKHERIHSGKITKLCHYFTNNVVCPFDDLGCKFLHTKSVDTIDDALKKNVVVESEDMINSFDITEETKVINAFLTSTPKSVVKKCGDCLEEWECVECLVKNTMNEQRSKNMKLF